MKFHATSLDGVAVVEPEVFGDDRGHFFECYHRDAFASAGIDVTFVQMNHSQSAGIVVRGLHFQQPRPQGKLVRVVRGTIFDAAVDVRQGSPGFGKWVGVELSAENHLELWIPPGFAHGFCTLADEVEITYLTTDVYVPEAERVVAWNDPAIGIEWPVENPTLSPRDAAAMPLSATAGLPVFSA